MNAHALLAHLNDAQRRAVTADSSAVLILAGAGTGKTRALVHRIAWWIATGRSAPREVLAVTFTNRAAREMRERLDSMLGANVAGALEVGTFHRVCGHLLRRYGAAVGVSADFQIYDEHDQTSVLREVVAATGKRPADLSLGRLRAWIDRAHNDARLAGIAPLPDESEFDRYAARILRAYRARLRAANALDFGELLTRTVELLRSDDEVRSRLQQRFRHVLVDEFQDTNRVQYELLRQLFHRPHTRLCAVGDEDQSIYSWRGARVANILSFPEDFAPCDIVRLEQNYRSTKTILAAAGSVIAHNRKRYGKTLWTEAPRGDLVEVYAARDADDEAAWVIRWIEALRGDIPLGEMAVCYRTHALSRSFEEALRRHGIGYRVVGGMRFFDRAEIRDAIAWLRLARAPHDDAALWRVLNVPPRGIGKAMQGRLRDEAHHRGCSLYEAARTLSAGKGRGIRNLAAFVELVERVHALARGGARLLEIATRALEWSGYDAWLGSERLDPLQARTRRENLDEFLTALDRFDASTDSERPTLDVFLEEVALVSAADGAPSDEEGVTLLSVHAAKGTEFDAVWLVGLEEGTLPHGGAQREGDEAIEEERRLCYVAMTRARRHLFLSWAQWRPQWRGDVPAARQPSRFLAEIPGDIVRMRQAERPAWQQVPWAQGMRRQPGHRASSVISTSARPAKSYDGVLVEPDWEGMGHETQWPALGERVFHSTLGKGRVLDVRGTGPRAKVRVAFDEGERTVFASYLLRVAD